MNEQTFETDFAGKKLIIKTGKLAEQANASCTVQCGETLVLATAVMSKELREGIDFFPLMVDYEEKMYAAGKIKGSRFMKREGRPSDDAVLTGRVIDRGLRPLFNQEMRNEVQVILTILSVDGENDPDVLAIIGAAAVLHISDIPWNGPMAGVRVAQVDGQFIANPNYEERNKSALDLTISVSQNKITMVEADAKEVDEATMFQAFKFGVEQAQPILKLLEEMRSKIGQEKVVIKPTEEEDLDENQKMSKEQMLQLENEAKELVLAKLDTHLFNIPKGSKGERKETLAKVKEMADDFLKEKQVGKDKRKKIMEFFYEFIEDQITKAILERDQRVDGRKLNEIRPLFCEVGVLPNRVHGSGLFNRGETQVLSVVTLGSPSDEQSLDSMEEDGTKRYFHHYNFPPFSVGETGRLGGMGRREIGHGALAEKALLPVLPTKDEFPYTVRVVSEVLGSNGSSSMASTCGSTLALMHAGVPIKEPVAGIAMGMASNEQGDYKILTDIQDLEDGKGGMDFKVTGTKNGLTAIQMDTKTLGITLEMIEKTLTQGKAARLEIIDSILKAIPEPSKEMSIYAPRITIFKINPEKIGAVIGSGGKIINEIIDATGVQIDIEDDGSVYLTGVGDEGIDKAKKWIEDLTREAEVGQVYDAEVVKVMEFGAFAEIFPGTDGLIHISEITDKERVMDVGKYLKEGDKVKVKVIKVDPSNGKISLSMKKAQQ